MEKTSKKSSPRLQLIISVLIMAALFLAELYVMINESRNIVLVVGIAVLILIALYFVVDAIMDCMNEKNIASPPSVGIATLFILLAFGLSRALT